MMFAGDACKAREGPKPALFHHFCYEKYCDTILKTPVADEEECTYCMDCQHPKTKEPEGNVPIRTSHDMTEGAADLSSQHLPPANPAKRIRAASTKNK